MLQAICDCSGYKSKYGKKEIMHRMMQFGYDSFGPEVLGNKNVMQVCEFLCSVCLLNGGLKLPSVAATAGDSAQVQLNTYNYAHASASSIFCIGMKPNSVDPTQFRRAVLRSNGNGGPVGKSSHLHPRLVLAGHHVAPHLLMS
jgi:hypothetical protein